MYTKFLAQLRKALYGIMLLGVFLSAFGASNLPAARAQEAATYRTRTLNVGTHSITTGYVGDSNFVLD